MDAGLWIELVARAAASLPAMITVIAKARKAEASAPDISAKIEAVLDGLEQGTKELSALIDSAATELEKHG